MSNSRFSITQSLAACDPELGHGPFRVLAILGTYSDPQGWCFPKISTIADIMKTTPGTTRRHISKLVSSGYLTSSNRYRENGSQTSNMYQIVFDFAPAPEDNHLPEEALDAEGGVTLDARGGGAPSATPYNDSILTSHINDTLPFSDFLVFWKSLFPEKTQPKSNNRTLSKKWKSRLKDDGFLENWEEALAVASKSVTCQSQSWFQAAFFLRNEENWGKCLNDWMQWKDGKSSTNKFEYEIDVGADTW